MSYHCSHHFFLVTTGDFPFGEKLIAPDWFSSCVVQNLSKKLPSVTMAPHASLGLMGGGEGGGTL
jgi:hypothetical protein